MVLQVTFLCDAILEDFDQALRDLYKSKLVQTDLKWCKREFQKLVQLFLDNRPKFTAARFFTVNRSTPLHLINSIITFLIVCIQFKN
jgi:gustatory receptor